MTAAMRSTASLSLLILSLACGPAFAELAPDVVQQVDAIAARVLAETGEPSVSIAIVKDRKLAYAQAYGAARLEPLQKAAPDLRYKIGSNTKQFVAVAMLLLVEQGKLSLDDKVARFFPQLTRAREISVRQLLSHTSGYQDYYALDYVAPFMLADTTPDAIIAKWARMPLDFEPGQRWEYSNTNYVIAGRIIEKLSGQSLAEFIRTRITDKLGMRSAIDLGVTPWQAADPLGYDRYAIAPLRPAVLEGRNWVYGAGQLAMTASDLARWDIALLDGTLLKPASRRVLGTEVHTANGEGTHYSLGLGVDKTDGGHLRWSHSGGMSGYVSHNSLYPDDGLAVVVLSNGPGRAASAMKQGLEKLLLAATAAAPATDAASASSLAAVRLLFAELQAGQPGRGALSADLNAYFTEQAVADFSASLQPLGEPQEFKELSREERGGMTYRGYGVKVAGKDLRISTYFKPDGKLDQFLVHAK